MTKQQILAIGQAIRVAYLRGGRDPEVKKMTATIHELRDYLIAELEEL